MGGVQKGQAGVKKQHRRKQVDEDKVNPSHHFEGGEVLCDFCKSVMLPRGDAAKHPEKDGEKE